MKNMLLSPFSKDGLKLKNRVVLAPMTRSRAEDQNTPNKLMADGARILAPSGMFSSCETRPVCIS